MRCVEYWDDYIRVLHGHHHVSNTRQFGASGYDGADIRPVAKSHDKGLVLKIITHVITRHNLRKQKRANTFARGDWIGTVNRPMASMCARIVSH